MIWNYLHLFKRAFALHLFVAIQLFIAASPIAVFAQKKIKDSFFKQYAKPETNSLQAKLQSIDSSQLYLIKFKAYPTSGLGKKFEALKVLGPLHYIVKAKTSLGHNEKVVEYIVEANSNWKVTSRLLKELGRIRSKDSLLIKAQIHQQITDSTSILHCNITKILSDDGIILAKVRKADWDYFIVQDKVLFADILVQPKEEIIINNLDLTLNKVRTLQSKHPELLGIGMVVSLKENLFDTTDVDLTGRYLPTPLASNTISNHATIMATIIGGNGISYGNKKGIAPRSSISSSDFQYLVPDLLADFKRYNISVQNHSYGTGIENYYGIEAAAYDKLIVQADTLIHVFSSGNIGNLKPTEGMYSGISDFANLSGSFKQAKNVLVVGGTDDMNQVEHLSSKGPAYDGRVKPELVAFGIDGTSGAAAIVSGTCALLQEQFQKLFQRKPSSALLRAILINSADDVDEPHVDYLTGFGALNALKAASNIAEGHFFTGNVKSNEEKSFIVNVPDSVKELKVTLTWNDPAAALNAPKAIVNNLDLMIEDPNAKKYSPWVLSTYPSIDSLYATAVRKLDKLNTIEQVTIENPAKGSYMFHIKGASISTPEQSFAISYGMQRKDQFEWIYPNRNEQLRVGEQAKIRWDSSISGKAIITYSLDNGLSWIKINDNITMSDRFAAWRVPSIFQSAKLKLEVGEKVFISESFNISTPVNLKIGFNCADSVMLHWPPQPDAIAYQISTLDSDTLKLFKQTTDTLMAIPKNQINSTYFTANAINNQNLSGLKGNAIDYRNETLQCYVRRLLADKTADDKVKLSLDLSTILNLKRIVWERKVKEKYIGIGETDINRLQPYQFIDEGASHGINIYRVRIESISGAISFSDPVSVTILKDADFMIFPNPVQSTVNVLSKSLGDFDFKIMDLAGKVILTRKIETLSQPIEVDKLGQGIYVYGIFNNGKKLYSGKLIKD